ncbi:Uncharacterized protein OBRU01_23771 [Operophtera brumata]|uniref:Uncharacterized protein n=1 Tax=Operophtera brumata TaxID=104452 RepID=A0A0L7KLV1_OPEBR|nr:Uncharacterized protein OBRU01_23771 [Operophtera brumata]
MVQRTLFWNIEDMLEWLRANILSYHIIRHVALLLLFASASRSDYSLHRRATLSHNREVGHDLADIWLKNR